MDSEQNIQSKYGNRRPFKAPAGYFDNLSQRIMSQLPINNEIPSANNTSIDMDCFKMSSSRYSMIRRFRPLAIAAVAIGIVLASFWTLSNLLLKHNPSSLPSVADRSTENTDAVQDGFEQAADYIMIDEDDMYAYLEGE